jgi:fatty acid desaturase
MFLIIGLVLLCVWLIGFGLFRAIVGGMIHVVLIIALFALAWHFLSHSSHASGGGTSASARVRRIGVSAPALAGHVRDGVVVT